MKPRLATALVLIALAGQAAAQDRAPDVEMRRMGAEATMAYMGCHKVAGDVVARVRAYHGASVAQRSAELVPLERCVAKARAEVEARIPLFNSLTSGNPRARAHLRAWYESWSNAIDRLGVDASGLGDPESRAQDVSAKLEKVLTEMRW